MFLAWSLLVQQSDFSSYIAESWSSVVPVASKSHRKCFNVFLRNRIIMKFYVVWCHLLRMEGINWLILGLHEVHKLDQLWNLLVDSRKWKLINFCFSMSNDLVWLGFAWKKMASLYSFNFTHDHLVHVSYCIGVHTMLIAGFDIWNGTIN